MHEPDEMAAVSQGTKEPQWIRGICVVLAVMFIGSSILEITVVRLSWKFAASSLGFGLLFAYVAWRGRPLALLG